MEYLDKTLVERILKATKDGDLKWRDSYFFSLQEKLVKLGADKDLRSFVCMISIEKDVFHICLAWAEEEIDGTNLVLIAVYKNENLIHFNKLNNSSIAELLYEISYSEHEIYSLLRYLDKVV